MQNCATHLTVDHENKTILHLLAPLHICVMEGEEVVEGDDLWQFSRYHNQGDKQDQSVDIVVKRQEPAWRAEECKMW